MFRRLARYVVIANVAVLGLIVATVALFIGTVYLLLSNAEISYQVNRISPLRKMEIASPVYESIQLAIDTNGFAVYVFHGVDDWKHGFAPRWQSCRKLANGYGVGYVLHNFTFSEEFDLFAQFRDKAYVAFIRPKRENNTIIMLWGFQDHDGDPPLIKAVGDICETMNTEPSADT